MARMIPDYIHRDCSSSAEKKLFTRFREELPEKFTVLHSLGIARHSDKLRAEIDFVVVCNRGLMCIEVKGGRIRQEHGIWSFINRFGEVNTRRESPFEQASSAMFALRRGIALKFGKQSPQMKSIIGYCVIFPDQTFDIESPEWDLNRLIDTGHIDQSLNSLMKEQFDYSASEILRAYGKDCVDMSESQTQHLLKYLRPDFELIPPISLIIRKSHEELLRLTQEQFDVLDMISNNERTVITGGAGTGKTLLAVEKARREAGRGRRVIIICYNRLLAEHIRKIYSMDSGDKIPAVYTLHGYARKIIEDAGLTEELPGVQNHTVFAKKYPELFERAVVANFDAPPFDLLIVDEGQDIKSGNYLGMLDWIVQGGLKNGNWIWFEDNQQNLFLRNRDDNKEKLLEKYHPATFRLTRNCRNTMPISIFNSLVTASERQKCLVDSAVKVKPSFYRSDRHQLALLKNTLTRLLGGGMRPGEIIILSPLTVEKSILAGRTSIAGFGLEPYEAGPGGEGKSIRFSTIQRFKGLESVVVIITDLTDLITPDARKLNYVAFSRPTSCLEVLIHEQARVQYQQLAYEFGLRN